MRVLVFLMYLYVQYMFNECVCTITLSYTTKLSAKTKLEYNLKYDLNITLYTARLSPEIQLDYQLI